MVWPLPRLWSETMVSITLRAQKTLEIKGFLGLERPFLDLVSQTPRPRGRGRPLFADRDQETHPKSRNTKKNTAFTRAFRKVRANFCLLACEASQELNRNCSEKLVQMSFLFWVDFCGWIFLLWIFRPWTISSPNWNCQFVPKSWFSGRGWGQQLSSIFRVRRFSEWPEPLHWIAFPVEIFTKPLIHWIASPLFTEKPFSPLKSASSHPLPKKLALNSARIKTRNCNWWTRWMRSLEIPLTLGAGTCVTAIHKRLSQDNLLTVNNLLPLVSLGLSIFF